MNISKFVSSVIGDTIVFGVSWFLSATLAIGIWLILAVAGICACVPDGVYFHERNTKVCVTLCILSFTGVSLLVSLCVMFAIVSGLLCVGFKIAALLKGCCRRHIMRTRSFESVDTQYFEYVPVV